MDLRTLRARCERRLGELELAEPFDLRAFCDALAARRGRPIVLVPVAGSSGPCGLWAATPTEDLVFYERDTSPLHQEHIILHEVCHLLCGHPPALVDERELGQLLVPDLAPGTLRHVLRRAAYSGDEEREAELLASLILERVGGGLSPGARSPAPAPEAAGLLDRLGAVLEEGGGRHA